MCGNLGSETLMRYSILGTTASWVHVVERLAGHYEVPVLADGAARQDAAGVFDSLLMDRVLFSKHGAPAALWEVVGERAQQQADVDASEEWMYTFNTGEDTFEHFNRAAHSFFTGDYDTASACLLQFPGKERPCVARLQACIDRAGREHPGTPPQLAVVGEMRVPEHPQPQQQQRVPALCRHGGPSSTAAVALLYDAETDAARLAEVAGVDERRQRRDADGRLAAKRQMLRHAGASQSMCLDDDDCHGGDVSETALHATLAQLSLGKYVQQLAAAGVRKEGDLLRIMSPDDLPAGMPMASRRKLADAAARMRVRATGATDE